MSLLPSRPDAEPSDDAGPRVIGVEDSEADDVLSALSSGTARRLLAAVHDEPAPPSELADTVDTSLQNVQYHLENLEDAGAIEVVDTAYSEKGREMDVYAAGDQPLVIFAGDDESGSLLQSALTRVLGALGLLALASLVIQSLAGGNLLPSLGGQSGGADGGGAPAAVEETAAASDAAAATETPTPTPSGDGMGIQEVTPTAEPQATPTPQPEATQTEVATEAARTVADGGLEAGGGVLAGLPPGALFFLGGLFVLAVVVVVIALDRR
jgi:DNA-binding transcriptional ArsR family regulator